MNSLFEYGIHTENSDIRAHVSVANKSVYVFKTACGVDALDRGLLRFAEQPGYVGPTARGKIVPWREIEDIRELKFSSWDKWSEFKEDKKTSEKGRLAVECVTTIMRLGRFPLWLDSFEDKRQNIQISGADIVLFCRKKIQVKCDYYCGRSASEGGNGTGNLFLQMAEINPFSYV
jgi:hypothetical protein